MFRNSIKPYLAIFFSLAIFLACNRENSQKQGSSGISKEASANQCDGDTELISAPEIKLKNLENKEVSLHDFAGKVVLLNFWASWCVPCVAEMPALERLYQAQKNKNFEIVAVSVDPEESSETVSKFVKEKGLSFTVLKDPEMSIPPQFGVTGFPETYFVGKNGELLQFDDPAAKCKGKRIIADRPWDAESFINAVSTLLN